MNGEFELIDAIRARIEAAGGAGPSAGLILGSGDDATITFRDEPAVISVDALIEDVHFTRPPFTARQVGHKALAAALSDLAAMGAVAREAYVQLGVPEDADEDDLLELADGLGSLAAATGTAVAGGDISRAPVLLLAVTAVGSAPEVDRLVQRSGGRPGNALVVTGELGGAAAGLTLLRRPELAGALDAATAAALVSRQTEPAPRLDAGVALAACGARAMIDISDGLGADAEHLANASGCGATIELDSLPLQAGVRELADAAGLDPLDLAVGGGEDYELLAAIDLEDLVRATAAVAATGGALTRIGQLVAGDEVVLSGSGGARAPTGFDQLR